MSAELAPCPFCGEADLNANFHRLRGYIECNNCGCTVPLPEKSPEIQALRWNRRTPPPPMEAVTWRWQEYDHPEDPWNYGETGSREHEEHANLQALFTHPPQPDALPGDLREKVRGAMKAWAQEDCSTGLKMMLTPKGFCDLETRILSLIQSERGEP